MKKKNNKNTYYHRIINFMIVCMLFSCFSCNRQDNLQSQQIDKLYIVEYNYIINSENHKMMFQVYGFSELDINFNLTTVSNSPSGCIYCNSNIAIENNLKKEIISTLSNYHSDTTFLPPSKGQIYDGNYYFFLIKSTGKSDINIRFIPSQLPKDLLSLYNHLYSDRQKSLSKPCFDELFKELEKSTLPNHSPILFTEPITE